MEYWGFAVLVVVVMVGIFVATRLMDKSGRNEDGTHGGGYTSSPVDPPPGGM